MANRQKGVGAYAGIGDLKVRADPRIDASGNFHDRPRQLANVEDGENAKSTGTVTDAKFGGGAMTRGVSSPKIKRHGP